MVIEDFAAYREVEIAASALGTPRNDRVGGLCLFGG